MPRRPRVFADGAIYHVYCRFAHGARVFAEAEEAERFAAILRDVKRTDDLTILAWCLMPTHYHLAVRTGRLPLWRSMRLVQGRFAAGHNRRHHTLGPLWQGRYKARLVEGQDALNRLIAYIHLNPVKARLVRSPTAYRLSGHRELLGRSRDPLVDLDETLRLYGTRRAAAMRAYDAIMRAVGQEAWSPDEPGGLPWWHRAAERDETLKATPTRPMLDALGGSAAPERLCTSVEDVAAAVGAECGIAVEQLRSRVQDRATVRARELVAVLAVLRGGAQVMEVGRCLGKPADTVSRWLSRGAKRRLMDKVFGRQLEALEARLRR